MQTFTLILIGSGGELARHDLPVDKDVGYVVLKDATGREWLLNEGDTLRVVDATS